MITFAYIVIGLELACTAVLLWLLLTAPEGYETDLGFRTGRHHKKSNMGGAAGHHGGSANK